MNTLTSESEQLFKTLATEAWKWDSYPLFNDDTQKLQELQTQHLISPFKEDGRIYISFTHDGVEKAYKEYAINIEE